jgi:hypothetical protein
MSHTAESAGVNAGRGAATTIIAGSMLFLIAAFSPISRVFGTRDAAQKLEIITTAPIQWTAAQLFFGLGSLVTAAGVAMLGWSAGDRSSSARLYAAAVLMGVGALLWCWHVLLRAVDPRMWTAREIPLWLFGGYSLLTIAGLALIGTFLLRSRVDTWVGRLAVGAAALFLMLGLLFGDIPPFVYYVVTLTVGVKLLRGRRGE